MTPLSSEQRGGEYACFARGEEGGGDGGRREKMEEDGERSTVSRKLVRERSSLRIFTNGDSL